MKTLFSLLFVLGLATTGLAQTQAPASVPAGSASLTIATSAKCGMCKQTLEKNLAFEKGVYASSLNVKSKALTVWYNPKKTTPDALRKAVTATGYDADSLQADPKAHDKLELCCQKGSTDHVD